MRGKKTPQKGRICLTNGGKHSWSNSWLLVAWRLRLAACKQPVGELFAVVSQNFCILIGQALCKTFRNDRAAAAVL